MNNDRMVNFYTLKGGKAVGPYGQEEIIRDIKKGHISAFDLIYRENDELWVPCHQLQEFYDCFKDLPAQSDEPDWVVLRFHEDGEGRRYLQDGPHTTEMVKQRLSDGRLSYRDFIWQKGSEGWKRIAALSQFNPSVPNWSASHQLLDDALDELARDLESVKGGEGFRVRRTPSHNLDVVPPEAEIHGAASKEAVRRSPVPVLARPSVARVEPPQKVPQRSSRIGIRMVFFAGVIAGVYFLVQGLKPLDHLSSENAEVKESPTSEVEVATKDKGPQIPTVEPKKTEKKEPVPSPPPSDAKKISAPEPPPPVTQSEAKRTPTWLKVKVLKGPRLTFTSDGSSHFPVELMVIGKAGDVLDQVSVVKTLKLRWKQDEKRTWSASSLGLSDGLYQFHATTGAVEAQGVFRVGKKTKVFLDRLRRHRKLISLPYQREKRGLLTALADFEGLLQKKVSASEVRQWAKKNLNDVTPKKADKFVFPEVWMSVSEQITSYLVGKLPQAELLQHVQKERADLEKRKLFAD